MARLKIRPQIFWDPSSNKYILKTSYSEAFLQEFKTFCTHSPTYNGAVTKTWSFDEADLDTVKTLVDGHFPEFEYGKLDFIEKPSQQQQRQNSSNGSLPINASAGAKAALEMFAVGEYEDAKKIYSILMQRHHPDKGGNAQKAATLTRAWKDLKTHFGWN